jgi:hypothetical protein
MIARRALPATNARELAKIAALDFEHEHSADRAQNDEVSFAVRFVIETPTDYPFVVQAGSL